MSDWRISRRQTLRELTIAVVERTPGLSATQYLHLLNQQLASDPAVVFRMPHGGHWTGSTVSATLLKLVLDGIVWRESAVGRRGMVWRYYPVVRG